MGVNSVVSDPADKHKLHTFTRAVAVDMESHLVARVADAHGLAFAAVRVISIPRTERYRRPLYWQSAPCCGKLARPSQVSPLTRLAAPI